MSVISFNQEQRIKKRGEKIVNVERAKINTANKLADIELERLHNEMKLEPTRDEADQIRCTIESKQQLKDKAAIFMFLSVIASIISVFMSCAGVSGSLGLNSLLDAVKGDYGIYILLMFFLQISIIVFSANSFILQKFHYNDYNKLKFLQISITLVSMACNYLFIMSVVNNRTTFYKIVTIVLASSCDLVSLCYSSTATNMKYRVYSNNDYENNNATLLKKMYIVLFGDLLILLENSYEKKLNKLKKTNVNNQSKNAVNTDKQDAYLDFSDEEKEKKYHINKIPENYKMHKKKLSEISDGEVINKDTFGLSQNAWTELRKYFEKEKLVVCKNKKTYKKIA